ncbi:MAG: thioesterase family protein [Bacillota bacterium]
MKDARRHLKVGRSAEIEEVVTEADLAGSRGSGSLDVYATPAMIALMERAAVAAVDDALPRGWITVGTSVEVRHLAATPPGAPVRARAELTEVDGRRLTFSVSARDHSEKIGDGTHQRYCVEKGPFTERARRKLR